MRFNRRLKVARTRHDPAAAGCLRRGRD